MQKQKKTARKIRAEHIRDEAFTEILKIEAQTNIGGAKETAQWIDNKNARDGAFIEIVKLEAKTDLDAAQKTAEMISEPARIKAFIIILLAMGEQKKT